VPVGFEEEKVSIAEGVGVTVTGSPVVAVVTLEIPDSLGTSSFVLTAK
jgi:hypothetical protein